MASPNPYTGKAKWPSQKQSGMQVADFAPYISNLVNMFRKVPRPMAPKTIDPVSGATISLADAKRQVSETTRAADLTTKNLDAQTGAAIRVGNLANKLRALSDLNSREAQINTQMEQQNKMINANIDAQNTGIINQYRDDLTNAEIAQQREQSANMANIMDKVVTQQAVKEQAKLERDRATIYSKMYNPGVYNRFLDSLEEGGMDVSGYSRPFDSSWANRGTPSPLVTKSSNLNLDTTLSQNNMKALRRYLKQRSTYATGGMMKVFTGDPKPKTSTVPGAQQSTNLNPNDMISSDPITRNARMADLFNSIIAKGYPISSSEGKAAISQAKHYFTPQFASDYATRVIQLQGEPEYKNMTPEQRIQRYYTLGKSGTGQLDKFLQQTSSYGGNPSAFYQRSPFKRYGGKLTKPFA